MRVLAMSALVCALVPGLIAPAEAKSCAQETAELPRIQGHDEAAP